MSHLAIDTHGVASAIWRRESGGTGRHLGTSGHDGDDGGSSRVQRKIKVMTMCMTIELLV